jgi:xylulokinase
MLEDQNPGAHILNLQFNRHTRAHTYRAALEGIAFSFVYGMQILKSIGLNINVLRVGNDNLFQSRIFAETIATLVDAQIELVESTGAVGAARASGVAIGAYASIEEALGGIQPTATISPQKEQRHLYEAAYQDWCARLSKVIDYR